VKRRTPVGTQPPISATEPAKEAAGLIVVHPRPDPVAAHRRDLITRVEQQRSIIVADPEAGRAMMINDDWLERLDLPAD
jgi:hypothetical protein